MSGTDELATFLTARYDEAEKIAKRMLDGAEPYVWPWEVWVTPGERGNFEWIVQPSIAVAEPGPKAYRRIWEQADSEYPHVDDGWVVHDSAICVWSQEVAKARLADLAAKRGRLDLMAKATAEMDRLLADGTAGTVDQAMAIGRARGATVAVKHDATIYASHPDYQEKWKP